MTHIHKAWVRFAFDGCQTICTCGYEGPIESRPAATKRAIKHARENNQ